MEMADTAAESSLLPIFGAVIARFRGEEYGPDYLTFEEGELVMLAVFKEEDEGWAVGVRIHDNTRGRFPPKFWAPLAEPSGLVEAPAGIFHPHGTVEDALTEPFKHATLGEPLLSLCDRPPPMPPMPDRPPPSPFAAASAEALPPLVPPLEGLVEKIYVLLKVANQKVKISALVAAGMSLGIFPPTKTHGKNVVDAYQAVRSRPELFEPLFVAKVPPSQLGGLQISCRH